MYSVKFTQLSLVKGQQSNLQFRNVFPTKNKAQL